MIIESETSQAVFPSVTNTYLATSRKCATCIPAKVRDKQRQKLSSVCYDWPLILPALFIVGGNFPLLQNLCGFCFVKNNRNFSLSFLSCFCVNSRMVELYLRLKNS